MSLSRESTWASIRTSHGFSLARSRACQERLPLLKDDVHFNVRPLKSQQPVRRTSAKPTRRSPIEWFIASRRQSCTVGYLNEPLSATRPCWSTGLYSFVCFSPCLYVCFVCLSVCFTNIYVQNTKIENSDSIPGWEVSLDFESTVLDLSSCRQLSREPLPCLPGSGLSSSSTSSSP